MSIQICPLHILKLGCLSFGCWIVWVYYTFWILDPYQMCDLQIFPPFLLVVCSFLDSIFWCTKDFNFNEVKFIYFFLLLFVFWGVISKNLLPNARSWRFIFRFKSFIVFVLTFKFLIHFQLLFHILWSKCPTSSFYMWISSCPSTICWS